MLMTRLCVAASNFRKVNRSTFHLLFQRTVNTKSFDDPKDKPIPLSATQVVDWKAEHTRAPPNERVWFTPYVVSGSILMFMVYFCIFREENDIDEIIYRPLPETLKGIDQAFPDVNFETKPEYVQYHEERKKNKLEVQQAKLQQK